jgi:ElaB/YqjD/DUF883 family membrane-anchored ribosome-binding protein
MNAMTDIDENRTQPTDVALPSMESIQQGKERFLQMKDHLWDRSKGMARDMNTCVHEHTWMALGVTAAAGIILGLAISRR